MYEFGRGVTRDLSQASAWYEKAASRGEVQAMYDLGHLYDAGPLYEGGLPQDYEKARYWLVKAAEGGNRMAMVRLSDMYKYGEGVQKDDTQASYWSMRAEATN
jgi:TPR repeat protein